MHRQALAPICLVVALVATPAWSQSGDWTTGGFDAQRSNWLRSDAKISFESMQKPGFELVWKMSLNEKGKKPAAVTAPTLLDFYIGYKGFRTLGFVGTSSNTVTAIDTDMGRVEWKKAFDAPGASGSQPQCPGGMTSGVARTTLFDYPSSFVPRGFGRGTPAKSAVGEPFEGAVTLREQPVRRPAPAPQPPKRRTTAASAAAAAVSPFAPRIQWVHALTADGKLHSMYVSNGEEPNPAVQFLPLNAHAQGLIVADNVAYVTTVNGCGGVDNGVWALDLESKQVTRWKSGDNIAGTAGPAFGPDGTAYVAAGGDLVALEYRTLKQKASFSPDKGKLTSSPVVFEHKGGDMVAAASSDGRIHVVDGADLSKPVASTPSFAAGQYAPGALASWKDGAGTRWILAPTAGAVSGVPATNGPGKNGAIVAWKFVDENGTPTLKPGWVSRDMASPQTPIIVNGVVFAVAGGGSGGSNRAVLYALDPLTGKELWSSGDTITAPVKRHGMAAGGSRVYVSTEDGMEYVFGFPLEI